MSVSPGPLWRADEIAAATGGQLQGSSDWGIDGFSIDTRSLQPGDLFVALSDVRDGHDFLSAARQAGAAAALVSRIPPDCPVDLPLLVVDDVLSGLGAIAGAARARSEALRIGITGSAGKTSTKDMLRGVFEQGGLTHAADRSFNNHIGVPLTLAALSPAARFGVFEMGMNHPEEIRPLSRLVQPNIAIITTIAAAHLENLGSMEAIAAAKAEIFDGLVPGGCAILPADNPYAAELRSAAARAGVQTIVWFGESDTADIRLSSFEPTGGASRVSAVSGSASYDFTLQSTGRHQAMNALAVIAAAEAAELSHGQIIDGLEAFAPGAGRGETHSVHLAGVTMTIIDESYNANPASMAASFALLAEHAANAGDGRRIAVLGDMKELGPDSAALHAGLAKPLLDAAVDLVFTAGPAMASLRAVLPTDVAAAHADTAIELLPALVGTVENGDVVLFKGSNASKVGELVAAMLAKAGERS